MQLDFTTFVCDLGHTNPYTNKVCDTCGEEFNELKTTEIDPHVVTRLDVLKPIYDAFEIKKTERKNWYSKFRKGEVQKEEVTEPFEKIQSAISKMDYEVSKEVFEDIDLRQESVNSNVTKKTINEVAQVITALYDIQIESEKIEYKMIWKNINNRITSSIKLYLEAYHNFFDSAITSNYHDAYKLQDESQKKLDFACNEINILSKIIDNQRISLNYDLIKEGEINISAILAMMVNSGENTFNETIEKTNQLTYYYFSSFITKKVEEINQEYLLNLSGYRYIGTTIFDDKDYLNKINVTSDILNKAYVKDKERFRNFLNLYLDKYIYMQQKINEFSNNTSYILGNNPPDSLLMNYSIKWYKDLSEGIYREASRIIYFCYKLVTDKEILDDDILTWLGFADIVGEFEQQSKLHLNLLTEGIEKIIRNSEAHVDYDINIEAGEITLRNLVPREKIKYEKKYKFEEFFEITNKLAETVFSIICGIQIFLYNNSDDFKNIIEIIEEQDKKISKFSNSFLLFPMNGIMIESEKTDITETTCLSLSGKLIDTDVDLKKLGDKVFVIFAEIARNSKEIDIIQLKLLDEDTNIIGNMIAKTKFLKEYFTDISDFKNNYLLLAKLTYKVDSIFTDGVTNNNDLICLKSIFTLLFEPLDKVNNAYRDKDILFNTRIKSEIGEAISEVESIEKIVYLYKDSTDDQRVITHLNMVITQVLVSLRIMKSGGLLTPNIKYYFDSLVAITNLFQEFVKVAMGELTFEAYLKNYIRTSFSCTKDIQVNDKCPCGSGKKFKHCCKNK